jgi:hypothetical protein
MTDTDDICGHPTTDGGRCQNPVTEGDSCWIDSHGGDVDGHGRPSKFTEQRAERAIDAAREGKSKRGCARAAGVSKSTFDDWLDENPPLEGGDFRPAFRRARAEGESTLIDGGLRDDDVNTSMAKFLLASSFDYQKSEKREVDASHEHTGEGGGPIQIEFQEEVVETPWSPDGETE